MSCLQCPVVHYQRIWEEPHNYGLRGCPVNILISFHFPTILVNRMAKYHLSLFVFISFKGLIRLSTKNGLSFYFCHHKMFSPTELFLNCNSYFHCAKNSLRDNMPTNYSSLSKSLKVNFLVHVECYRALKKYVYGKVTCLDATFNVYYVSQPNNLYLEYQITLTLNHLQILLPNKSSSLYNVSDN